ncbi:MAG: hypothetical protein ABIH49_01110 [archaeon]
MRIIRLLVLIILIVQIFSLVAALSVKSVSTEPQEVAPGEIVKMTIKLENNLGYDLESVDVSLVLSGVPFAPKGSSSDFSSEIDDDDSESFNFELISSADAIAGAYEIPVHVNYQKSGDNLTLSKDFSVSVIVNAKPDLTLSSEGFLIKNQKNEIEIKVTNIGLGKAKFLEVELGGSGLYDILSSNNIYVGDLESDDFDSVSFDVFAKQNGMLEFPITLNYRDAMNNQITEAKKILIKSYDAEEAQSLGLVSKSNTLIYVSVAVLILVAWFFWRKLKKKKRKQ